MAPTATTTSARAVISTARPLDDGDTGVATAARMAVTNASIVAYRSTGTRDIARAITASSARGTAVLIG